MEIRIEWSHVEDRLEVDSVDILFLQAFTLHILLDLLGFNTTKELMQIRVDPLWTCQ